MITRLFERVKQRRAVQDWRRSPLGQMLAMHTQEYFTKYPRLAKLSKENKGKIVTDFYEQVFNLAKAENPFLAMRELVASYVISYAGYTVWCMTEEDNAAGFWSPCPYISGLLYKHMDQAAQHVDELRELKWKHPEVSTDDLVSYYNSRCVLYLYYLNGFNYVRGEGFDDLDKEKDWLRPFMKSQLIWEEDQARQKIGLKSLLPNIGESLKYGSFMNLVAKGHKNPYFEWEKLWGEGLL